MAAIPLPQYPGDPRRPTGHLHGLTVRKASADIFKTKQAGRVSKLEADGKLTSGEATVLDSLIGVWAGGIADKGSLLGGDWRSLNSMIRTDERTKAASSSSASSTGGASASTTALASSSKA